MNPAVTKIATDMLKGYVGKMLGAGKAVKTALEMNPRLATIATGTPEAAAQALTSIPKIGPALGAMPLPMSAIQGAAKVAPAVAGGLTSVGATGGTLYAIDLLNRGVTSPRRTTSQYRDGVMPIGVSGATPVSYANQMYVPGMSPYTNQLAAESFLEQQKFENQMRLIAARNAAASGAGSLYGGGGNIDMMGLAQQVFTPVTY